MTAGDGSASPAYLVRGDDASVLAQAVRELVQRLVGERDPSLILEEHMGAAPDFDVGAVVDAFTTPPFLVDRRVVVVREAGRLRAADAARLVEALEHPPSSSVLVLAGGGGTIPQALVRKVSAIGQLVDAGVGTGRTRARWTAEHIRQGPVRLSSEAATMLSDHLGDDLGRLKGILEMLGTAYGEGSRVGADELAPFLGEAGSVPPWDLTDEIDAGRAQSALVALRRMQQAGGRAPQEILALLHRHFEQMLRLDGGGVATAEDAASLLGTRSSFVAKKALAQSRQLGFEHIGQAIVLLGQADLDLKGESAMPHEAVLEVLVARLSRLKTVRSAGSRLPS